MKRNRNTRGDGRCAESPRALRLALRSTVAEQTAITETLTHTVAEQAEIIKTLTETTNHLKDLNKSLKELDCANNSYVESLEDTTKQQKAEVERLKAELLALRAHTTFTHEQVNAAFGHACLRLAKRDAQIAGLVERLEQVQRGVSSQSNTP
jgi:predicted nuclease with TOPRIM domain